MSRRKLSARSAALACLAWMLLCVLHPCAALAHASLVSSDPANDALLMHAPSTLRLTFNEDVEVLAIRMVDETGAISPVTQIDQRGASLVLSPPALKDGANVISWRVISADGHPVSGSVTFWVGRRGTQAPEIARTEDVAVRTAIWSARWMIYVGLFFAVGGAFFVTWMQPSQRWIGPFNLLGFTGLFAIALSVGLQGLDELAAPLSSLRLGSVWSMGAHGSFGRSAAIAAAAIALAIVSLRLRNAAAKPLSLLGLLGVGAALASSGHAANAEPRFWTTLAVFAHGASLAFWLGALAPLGYALRGAGRHPVAPLLRFSRWIPFAVAALLVSGLFLSVVQVEHVAALWTTNYGRVLLSKLVLVALLLGLALWNRMTLTPQAVAGDDRGRRLLRRSIGCELLLVCVILGVVGLWRFTPPPRSLAQIDNESFFTHIHSAKAMANVTISPGRAGPVEIVVQLETGDERPLAAKALTVTLSNERAGIEPFFADARLEADNLWHVRTSAPVAGRWMLELGILISDFEKVNIEAPILVR